MRDRFRGALARHRRALGVLWVLYWCAMFVATHIELPQTDSAPQNTDKVVHLVMYLGFAFLLSIWLSTRRAFTRMTALFVVGLAVGYAVLDELLQTLTESRSAEAWDFVMDLLGAILGLGMFWLTHRKFPWLWEAEGIPVHGDD